MALPLPASVPLLLLPTRAMHPSVTPPPAPTHCQTYELPSTVMSVGVPELQKPVCGGEESVVLLMGPQAPFVLATVLLPPLLDETGADVVLPLLEPRICPLEDPFETEPPDELGNDIGVVLPLLEPAISPPDDPVEVELPEELETEIGIVLPLLEPKTCPLEEPFDTEPPEEELDTEIGVSLPLLEPETSPPDELVDVEPPEELETEIGVVLPLPEPETCPLDDPLIGDPLEEPEIGIDVVFPPLEPDTSLPDDPVDVEPPDELETVIGVVAPLLEPELFMPPLDEETGVVGGVGADALSLHGPWTAPKPPKTTALQLASALDQAINGNDARRRAESR
jgi:hypothetical protein